VWPFESTRSTEALRVGRHAIERWSQTGNSLELVGSQALPAGHKWDAESLASTLQALYPTPSAAEITAVFESVWLPLILVEVGPTLWKPTQIEALLRHRLNLAYGQASIPAAGWELRADHVAGERFALGYGLQFPLKQCFVEAGSCLGLKWAALVPSFSWGLGRLNPSRRWIGRTGWYCWPEQDRMVLARLAANRVVALHPCASFTHDPEQILRAVEIERIRCGTVVSGEPICAATWGLLREVARPKESFSWVSIALPDDGRKHAVAHTAAAKVLL
jgi:hypothetical protein